MNARKFIFAALVAVAGPLAAAPSAPLPLARDVDLARFMGDWYVISATPTPIDSQAHDAVESYRLASDSTIEVTYTFRHGSFDGPQRRYHPRGFVREGRNNAVWGMQFIWPVKADYRIAYLADDYSQVVIAREDRDYAWIMARTPRIAEADLQRHLQFLAEAGYDTATLRRVPHR